LNNPHAYERPFLWICRSCVWPNVVKHNRIMKEQINSQKWENGFRFLAAIFLQILVEKNGKLNQWDEWMNATMAWFKTGRSNYACNNEREKPQTRKWMDGGQRQKMRGE
jgi:hypothetical protein